MAGVPDQKQEGNEFFHLPRKIVVGIACILLLGALLMCAKSDWSAHAPKLLAHISPSMTAAGAHRSVEMSNPAAADTAVANHVGRYIFLDLGANKADTLKVFLGYPDAKFNFSFATPPNDTRGPQDAEIFLFEANPLFNLDLVRAKEDCAKQGITVHVYPSQIVHTEDSVVDFYVDAQNVDKDFWASAMKPDSRADKADFQKTRLTAINLATFLLKNFLPEDFVVVKMDIESAEYAVIPHLNVMGAAAVVDYMYVEWHTWFGSVSPKQKKIASMAQAAMEAAGTQFPAYNSPA